MNKSWEFFSAEELKCKCGECGSTGNEMEPNFMARVVEMRREAGFAFYVSSAYRCPTHNRKVSGTGGDGPHTTGKAMDIAVSHEQAYKLLKLAFKYGFTGIGVSQKGGSRFIHIDDLTREENFPRPNVWSY